MKKIIFLSSMLAILAAPITAKSAPGVTASFAPNTAEIGQQVTFTWNSGPRFTSCIIMGVPGLRSEEKTGSHTFTAQNTLNAGVLCEGRTDYDWGNASAKLTVIDNTPPPPPTITISYPDSVFVDDAHSLKITTVNANSCTYVARFDSGASTYPQSIGTSYNELHAYSSPSTVTQEVTCDGDGGTSVEKHQVSVIAKPSTPPPTISHFYVNQANLSTGDIKLTWASHYTDRCTLASLGVTANVTVNSPAGGYDAHVRLGGQRYTLSCFQNNKSVSRVLDIARDGQFSKSSTSKTLPLTAFIETQKLGLDLEATAVTHELMDLNGDGFNDMLVYDGLNNKAFVLISEQGVFNKISAEYDNIFSFTDIQSLSVTDEDKVNLEVNRKALTH